MRLPSIQYLFDEARRAASRFPLVVVASLVAAACGVVAAGHSDRHTVIKALVAAQLGIPLFFSIVVAAESARWPRGARAGLAAAGVVALVAYAFSLPDWMHPGAVTRHLQLNVGLHLLAAFAPFAGRGRINGFWQYNKSIFLRFLTSALYSAVVYVGLTIALVALDKLLGLSVDEETYLRLWIVIAFVFNTIVFVGGVPVDISALDGVTDYPRGLRVFAQYILISLVVIYLVILTTYLFKVIITTVWPSGWIGYLVSSVAVAGILALLLVWPVSARDENRWVATYTRWFFIFMIPAIGMLLMAIYKRVDQYGVTENRYFLAVLSAWLAAIAVYFIASRHKNIKLIPVTLCAIAFATSFGPWGAYAVSRDSQTERLRVILERNGILEDGRIRHAEGDVTFEDRKEISAISRYLVQHHGMEAFEPWLGEERLAEVDTLDRDTGRYNDRRVGILVEEMGLEYVEQWATSLAESGRFNFNADGGDNVFALDGADYCVNFTRGPNRVDLRDAGGHALVWNDTTGFELRDASGVVLRAPLDAMFDGIETSLDIDADPSRMPAELLSVSAENERARLRVYFRRFSGNTADGVRTVNYFDAVCFVTFLP